VHKNAETNKMPRKENYNLISNKTHSTIKFYIHHNI